MKPLECMQIPVVSLPHELIQLQSRNVRQTAENEERYPTKEQSFSKKKDCFLAIHGTLRLDIFNSQGYSILILPQWSKLMTCSFLR